MKKAFVAVITAVSLVGCTSVESTTVSSNEITAQGGDAVAVVQASALGLSALLQFVDLIQADLDTVVNKMLVSEAKAMGASKVDLKGAATTPRHGIFALFTCPTILLCMTQAQANGVAVK
jgi:hypothetical protein